MLNKDQISVLNYLIENEEERITEHSTNAEASLGVARFLVAKPENFEKLSKAQSFHYENSIRPLIESVLCDGMIGLHEDGASSCVGNEFIEEDSLLDAYILDDMRCQQCISTQQTYEKNNSD